MQNVGTFDRSLRLILAISFAYFGLTPLNGSDLGHIALVVSFLMGVSGLMGVCFLYRLFGIDTRDRGAL
jgi:hypothetical protein